MFSSASGISGVDICNVTAVAISLGPNEDPFVKAAKEQIDFWIDFWINNVSLHQRIQVYWGNVWKDIKGGADRWKKIKGPIGATIGMLAELGWDPLRADLWRDPQGVLFVLRGPSHYHPSRRRFVCQYIECSDAILRDATSWAWNRRKPGPNSAGPDGAYDCQTVVKLHTFLKNKGDHKLAGALLMGVCNGVPDRSILYNKGVLDSPRCVRCNDAIDSPKHRVWQCSADNCTDDLAIKATQRLARFVEDDNEMFWNIGLIAKSMYPPPSFPDCSLDFCNGDPVAEGMSHCFYSDGSGGMDSDDPYLRRCGWGYVCFVNGALTFGRGGGLPSYKQTIPRVELFAILNIVRTRPPTVIPG